jgi:hypothetical protein
MRGEVGRRGEVIGGREVGGKNFGVEKRMEKPKTLGRGGYVFGSSQNDLNGLILNWCIGGCWFTPANSQGT